MDTKSKAQQIVNAGYYSGHCFEIAQAYLTQCQEVERLREALKPMINGTYYITSEDIERAREALKEKQ